MKTGNRKGTAGAPEPRGLALRVVEVQVFYKLVSAKVFRDEEGQDMVEYALLLGFVCLASVAILTTLNTDIRGLWTSIATRLASSS